MPITIKRSYELNTTNWTGGTTTELFIFPATANYQQRDFDFRISTAMVAAEQSVFTSLPGYSRKLMVLQGAVSLFHRGHYSKVLTKFDVDEFEGSWETTSQGRCTDFNLMCKLGTEGSMEAEIIEKGKNQRIEVAQTVAWFFLYPVKGTLELSVINKTMRVGQGDFAILKNDGVLPVQLKTIEHSEVIFTRIYR